MGDEKVQRKKTKEREGKIDIQKDKREGNTEKET